MTSGLRRPVTTGLLVVALALAILVSTGIGAYDLSPWAVARDLIGGGSVTDVHVVRDLRVARVLVAAVAGGALGAAGSVFQHVMANPLASPDVIGVNAGASLGAVLTLLFVGDQSGAISAGALVGGMVAASLAYLLGSRVGTRDTQSLILIGVGLVSIFASLTAFMLATAQMVEVRQALVWLTGTLNGRGWPELYALAVPVGIGSLMLAVLRPHLRLLHLETEQVLALGAPVKLITASSLTAGVCLAAGATAAIGPVGFVALAAPHIARRLARSPGPCLLQSAVTGATLLVLADLAARRAFQPTELPAGVATAIVGAPLLLALLIRERRIDSS